jgi:hypothetical protein
VNANVARGSDLFSARGTLVLVGQACSFLRERLRPRVPRPLEFPQGRTPRQLEGLGSRTRNRSLARGPSRHTGTRISLHAYSNGDAAHLAPPDLVPAFPYHTMNAEGQPPTSLWQNRCNITPFNLKPATYSSTATSAGFFIPEKSDRPGSCSRTMSDFAMGWNTRRPKGLLNEGPRTLEPGS